MPNEVIRWKTVGVLPSSTAMLFSWSVAAAVSQRQTLAMLAQRAALLGVMVINKKPSRNGVTAYSDGWVAAAYEKKCLIM